MTFLFHFFIFPNFIEGQSPRSAEITPFCLGKLGLNSSLHQTNKDVVPIRVCSKIRVKCTVEILTAHQTSRVTQQQRLQPCSSVWTSGQLSSAASNCAGLQAWTPLKEAMYRCTFLKKVKCLS